MARRVQLVVALAVLVGWLLLIGPAQAATTLSQFPPNPGVLPGGGWKFTPGTTFADPPPPRAWVNGTYGGVPGVKATDALTLRGPAGNLAVNVARSASVSAVVAAAARCLGNPICMTATAAGAAVIADYFGEDRITQKDGGGLLRDPGTDPVPGYEWAMGSSLASWQSSPYRGSTADAAHSSYVAAMCTAWTSQASCGANCSYVCTPVAQSCGGSDYVKSCSGGKTRQQLSGSTVVADSPIGGTYYRNDAVGAPMGEKCPASVDALNPAYSIPEGSPVGVDGKCPTARYNHVPITVQEAVAFKESRPPSDPSTLADKTLSGGETVPAEWEPASGPASQQGPAETSTETGPNGTITTTKTPTYTYNYGGDTITYNQSWTTIVNNNGQVTTTVTNPAPVQSTEQDPTNPCTQNPDAAGCQKLDVPTGDNLPTRTVNVSAANDAGWGAGTGACPGLVHTSLVGDVDPFGLVCTYMSGIRFAVIGFAGIMAALILLGRIE